MNYILQTTGWIPCFKKVSIKLGVSSSVVFGLIWRECQNSKEGVCTLSQKQMSLETGITIRSINTHIGKLKGCKFIEVETEKGSTSKIRIAEEGIFFTGDFQN